MLWLLVVTASCTVSQSRNTVLHRSNGVFQSNVLPYINPRAFTWINSGKFQGDIDGIDGNLLKEPDGLVFFNALKNHQFTWTDGIVPYEMDVAFVLEEVEVIKKAFESYTKNTCIRFQPRNNEDDYLHIVKGYGCYSQVGRTGGKQEISLGDGCLYNEIVVHELMHSIGFWHEHSRVDRDDHINIRWENILPDMESQFEKVSAFLQDTLGEKYDYQSIMHYDSTAFSRNGKNTIETIEDGFTEIIGRSIDLSELDIVKVGDKRRTGATDLFMLIKINIRNVEAIQRCYLVLDLSMLQL